MVSAASSPVHAFQSPPQGLRRMPRRQPVLTRASWEPGQADRYVKQPLQSLQRTAHGIAEGTRPAVEFLAQCGPEVSLALGLGALSSTAVAAATGAAGGGTAVGAYMAEQVACALLGSVIGIPGINVGYLDLFILGGITGSLLAQAAALAKLREGGHESKVASAALMAAFVPHGLFAAHVVAYTVGRAFP